MISTKILYIHAHTFNMMCIHVCRYVHVYILCAYVFLQSFRFGPEIAYVAACTLSTLKDVWRKTLVGSIHPGVYNLHVWT